MSIAIVRVVPKRRFPLILAVILIAGYAYASTVGLTLAAFGVAVIYVLSLWINPRMGHGRCNGTGLRRGRVFTWTHHKCPRCQGGRIIRRGAGIWGAQHVRREHRSTKEARARARSEHAWR